jgi:hypothetical protein
MGTKVERRKIEGITKETPCRAILNEITFFSEMENRKVKQVLSGGWYQWGWEDIRKGGI